ncbi:hypothetical protein EKO04_001410 [Ascochyta lentis]|uniref:Uncharacterized protein n=1 Tax=Ascochyta lentis TaxID=205686 RepID=A0A8H7JDG2_9PLEO|nr:hypothetical protein EKO04_001410 [Ascochyta lentis]
MPRRSAQYAAKVPAPSHSSASDAEGDESQRVTALSSLLQTPKPKIKDLQNFKAKITADQQELKALLEQRQSQAEEFSTRRRNELTKSILDALQTPNQTIQGVPPTLGNTKIARNAIFKSAANICAASEHLVDEYIRLDTAIAEIQAAEPEGVAEAWTADVEKTARLLKIGAETAIKNLKKVLGADVEANKKDEKIEAGEGMDKIEKMELNYELQKSLQYAERGVKKMVKNLPQDEDVHTASNTAATRT